MAETTMKNKKDTKCKRTADSAVAGLTGSSLLTLLRSLLTLHRSLLKKKRQKAIALQSLMWQASKVLRGKVLRGPCLCVCVCVCTGKKERQKCVYTYVYAYIYIEENRQAYISDV
jgi:hypothetical protein